MKHRTAPSSFEDHRRRHNAFRPGRGIPSPGLASNARTHFKLPSSLARTTSDTATFTVYVYVGACPCPDPGSTTTIARARLHQLKRCPGDSPVGHDRVRPNGTVLLVPSSATSLTRTWLGRLCLVLWQIRLPAESRRRWRLGGDVRAGMHIHDVSCCSYPTSVGRSRR
ncbi:hypothetical protein C8Q79DRAFT_974207 [Trametes meyenii]|nr:hypothetical protein C8Q79DRAFT_974207 [Trametes meyenii]